MWCGPRLRPNFCKMARDSKSLATLELHHSTSSTKNNSSVFFVRCSAALAGRLVRVHEEQHGRRRSNRARCIFKTSQGSIVTRQTGSNGSGRRRKRSETTAKSASSMSPFLAPLERPHDIGTGEREKKTIRPSKMQ